MKPLDLERFEGATAGKWMVSSNVDRAIVAESDPFENLLGLDVEGYATFVSRSDAELAAAAPQLLAELKALRAWREAVVKAYGDFYERPVGTFTSAYDRFLTAWNAAETEFSNEIQSNN